MTAFDALFVPPELRAAVSGRAWLAAMLAAERALAAAGSRAGIVPAEAAAAIAAACDPDAFDLEALVDRGRAAGTPVEPLVRELRASVGAAERYVHFGATSQDILDTAAMLVTRHGLDLVAAELGRAADACAVLAKAHRSTPIAGRTLMQQAVPTTFGLKASGWLIALLDARRRLGDLQDHGLAAQLGGAAGTLSALGADGIRVLELFAAELELPVPTLPWHTNRARIAELGGALGIAAGSVGKIGLDIVLLAQTEVREVFERPASGGGGSSTMPQKRNPVGAVLARASARTAAGHAGVLAGALEQEHERAAGAWQAEWEALSGALAFTGAAAASIAGSLEGLEVDAARMRANLGLTDGLVNAERVSFLLAERLGRDAAHDLVAAAAQETGKGGFRGALLADPACHLTEADLGAALDPATYLGSAEAFVDRALARHDGDRAAA